MRQQLFGSTSRTRTSNHSSRSGRRREGNNEVFDTGVSIETDPLLPQQQCSDYRGSVRARRAASRSPVDDQQTTIAAASEIPIMGNTGDRYAPAQQQETHMATTTTNYSSTNTSQYEMSRERARLPQHYHTESKGGASSGGEYRNLDSGGANPQQQRPESRPTAPTLLEIPEEVYTVRKAALKVMKPLIASWLVVSVGFAVTVLLGMARWTRLLTDLPYWFILLPSWCSHVALLWCHIKSARALSKFIAQANDNRQRTDSTDPTDRTEYLPLLQRSLKFGFKTGMLSFSIFLFELLLYIKLARDNLSLAWVLTPLWALVGGAILDGMVCKTQHFARVVCWILIFTTMVLTVLKMDHGYYTIPWRMVVSPVVCVLSICSATLMYIVYGHQVGYYRLTEAQLTAGILYSMAALICIVLVVLMGEVMPLSRPVEIETRLFFVVMAPLVVCLAGMGAWAVSRDEFGRLLLYGGQTAVHPRKLRWEANGWTSVQSTGVTNIPMFGEVHFSPLDGGERPRCIQMCPCCSCYPYEEEDKFLARNLEKASWRSHPYLAPAVPIRRAPSRRGSSGVSVASSI